MNNSNELFKTFIINNLKLAKRGMIPKEFAQQSIMGYYKALEDLNGVDELTTLYKDLAGFIYCGTRTQRENAENILNGVINLSDLASL